MLQPAIKSPGVDPTNCGGSSLTLSEAAVSIRWTAGGRTLGFDRWRTARPGRTPRQLRAVNSYMTVEFDQRRAEGLASMWRPIGALGFLSAGRYRAEPAWSYEATAHTILAEAESGRLEPGRRSPGELGPATRADGLRVRGMAAHYSYATVSSGSGAKLARTPPSPVPMSSADSASARIV